MKIAIVGAGFFGTSIALTFAKKHHVCIYEKENEILKGASEANQFRYHLGYHYPRSNKTIDEILKADIFNRKNGYFKDFLKKNHNYYGINKTYSKISFLKYLEVLKKKNLYYRIYKNKILNSVCKNFIFSKEQNLNFFKYKKFIQNEIKKNPKITLNLNCQIVKKDLPNYDKVIVCTYSNINFVLKDLGIKRFLKFKYELIEKLVIKLPKYYKKKSFVILDGIFANLDPYEGTKYHLLSDVLNSKIEVLNTKFPNFKDPRKKFLNKGLIKAPKSTYKKALMRCASYFPFLKNSKYMFSLFSVRTLKQRNKNDSRNSEIININKKIYVIFSGKWMSSYYTAYKLYRLLN